MSHEVDLEQDPCSMVCSDKHFFDLLELLHEAPGSTGSTLRFLDRLRAAISPDVVTLIVADPHEQHPGVLLGSGLGASPVYLADFLRPSVRHPSRGELPLGAVYQVPGSHQVFVKSALFREVLAPAGVLPGPGLFVICERDERHIRAALLVLPTSASWKPTASDHALLSRLAPHLVIARRLGLRIVKRQRDAEALLAAFDRLALGVVLLDERGRISLVNQSAAETLGVSSGFASREALASDVPDERTQALERVLQGAHGDVHARVYTHPADGRPLQVLATPFRWERTDGIEHARFSRALFIGDAKRLTRDPVDVLHELYRLTPGETRLALLLVSGCTVEEAAKLLGISVGTCRGVLKKVFEKTGTNRQAELVRMLLTGFGQVRAPAGGPGPA